MALVVDAGVFALVATYGRLCISRPKDRETEPIDLTWGGVDFHYPAGWSGELWSLMDANGGANGRREAA